MTKFLAFVTAVSLTLSAPAAATEWQPLGPRALGMGGAGVAVPQGGQSGYWNPALLGLSDNPNGAQFPVTGHLGITGSVLRGANDLNQVSKDCSAGGSGCTDANIQNALNELNVANNGVRGDVGAGAGFKMGKIAVFGNNFTYVGAKPLIDVGHNTQATVNQNTSSLQVRGLNVTEIGVAYGHELPFAPGLNAGLAVKGMVGRTGFQNESIVTSSNDNGALDKFTKNMAASVQPGVDLGLLWDVNRAWSAAPWRPRLGLTARNINNPRFKNTDAAIAAGLGSKTSLQGNVRMGVAISPLRFWNVAADADLTRNLTAVEGVKSQELGLGTEVNVFNRSWLNVPLRAGLSKNVADSQSKTALSAGVGLNFLHVNLDLAARVSPGRETTQSQGKTVKLPTETTLSAQFSVLFGGQDAPAAPESGLADTAQKPAKPKK